MIRKTESPKDIFLQKVIYTANEIKDKAPDELFKLSQEYNGSSVERAIIESAILLKLFEAEKNLAGFKLSKLLYFLKKPSNSILNFWVRTEIERRIEESGYSFNDLFSLWDKLKTIDKKLAIYVDLKMAKIIKEGNYVCITLDEIIQLANEDRLPCSCILAIASVLMAEAEIYKTNKASG